MAKFRKKPVVIEAFRLNERGLIAAFRWGAIREMQSAQLFD